MGQPNESHLIIEAAIRGLSLLLPEEGFAGFTIRESTKRGVNSKILRVERDGRPFMAFDREGSVFDFWFSPESLHLIKSYGPNPRERNVGQNAGFHSNIDHFFGELDCLWHVRLNSVDNAVALLEDLQR